MSKRTSKPSAAEASHRLGVGVARVGAVAMLARAVADHVPIEGLDSMGNGGKLDCLDAIELWMLRPAVAELQDAHEKATAVLAGAD